MSDTPAEAAPAAVPPVRLGPRSFHLLADEDPAEFRLLAQAHLYLWAPRDPLEQELALAILWASWRQSRADRLETQVLETMIAAGASLIDPAHNRAFALALRYRRQLAQERKLAELSLARLQRRPPSGGVERRDEPERQAAAVRNEPDARAAHAMRNEPESHAVRNEPRKPAATAPAVRYEPEEPTPAAQPKLNRHQRRALERQRRKAG